MAHIGITHIDCSIGSDFFSSAMIMPKIFRLSLSSAKKSDNSGRFLVKKEKSLNLKNSPVLEMLQILVLFSYWSNISLIGKLPNYHVN